MTHEETIMHRLQTLNAAHTAFLTGKRQKEREEAAWTVTECRRWFHNQHIPCEFAFGQYMLVPHRDGGEK